MVARCDGGWVVVKRETPADTVVRADGMVAIADLKRFMVVHGRKLHNPEDGNLEPMILMSDINILVNEGIR